MKKTRSIYIAAIALLFLVGCQQAADTTEQDEARALFEKNAKNVGNWLEAWQNETLNHADYYAQDFSTASTGFGEADSVKLDDVIEGDKANWAKYDFEMVDPPFNLLPGVNVDTKMPDGSVRYYGDWRVISPASDSTEERSGVIKIYSAFVFNEEGKIRLQLTYGDFGGLIRYLDGAD